MSCADTRGPENALLAQDLSAITSFLACVEATVPHIDILVNNAAQTLSRPPAFYNYLHRWLRC